MTTTQKIIKIIALAFAMALAVSIISAGAFFVFGLIEGVSFRKGDEHLSIEIGDVTIGDVKTSDKVKVKVGNTVRVDTSDMVDVNIADKIKVQVNEKVNGNDSVRIKIGEKEAMFGSKDVISFTKEFTKEEEDKIKRLDLYNYDGQLTICPGDSLKVEAKDVPDHYVAKIQSSDTFYLGYEGNTVNISNFILGKQVHPQITLTLPMGKHYEAVFLDTGSGAVDVTDLLCDTLSFDFSSGRVTAKKLVAESFVLDSASGSVNLSDVKVSGKMDLNTGSGAVTLSDLETGSMTLDSGSGKLQIENATLGNFSLKGASGSVTLSDVTVIDYCIDSGSGRVDFQKGKIGGNISINSSSGGISIQAQANLDDYRVECDTGSGGVWLNGVKLNDGYRDRNSSARRKLTIDGGSGRISIELR